MTVQQYFDKIINFRVEQSSEKDLRNADLERLILKISLDENEIYFTLDTLFEKTSNEAIVLNPEIVKRIANRYGLFFLDKKETGNVCFANSEELRFEFKQSFTAIDLLDLCYAVLHSSIYEDDLKNETQKIPIPIDSNVFWKLVQFGNTLRNQESE